MSFRVKLHLNYLSSFIPFTQISSVQPMPNLEMGGHIYYIYNDRIHDQNAIDEQLDIIPIQKANIGDMYCCQSIK